MGRAQGPCHVSEWLDGKAWGDFGKRTATTAVKHCFGWAVDEGLLKESPVGRVKRPAVKRREPFTFFDKGDSENVDFRYRERTANGSTIRLCKFIRRDEAWRIPLVVRENGVALLIV